tara:strand:- start:13255 stop:13404 length:150 start_codon:yes stop_codon:yes gene_type:complete
MKLSERQKKTLLKHAKHHSSKHMKFMRSLMSKGQSFTKAHKAAQKKVGT